MINTRFTDDIALISSAVNDMDAQTNDFWEEARGSKFKNKQREI